MIRNLPRMRFGIPGICAYCGNKGNEIDHVIPLSMIDHKKRNSRSCHGVGVTTYACRRCNSWLSDLYFPTMRERIAYIQKKLSKKARKYGRNPAWSDEEICELDDTLRSYVASAQERLRELDAGTSWVGSMDYQTYFYEVTVSRVVDKYSPMYNEFLAGFFRGILG